MATLVLCGDVCIDGFASLGEQLLPGCIHCSFHTSTQQIAQSSQMYLVTDMLSSSKKSTNF